ncbi:hypothetical protein BH09MYX1_BH09MYX1_24110 [soil metagenome]
MPIVFGAGALAGAIRLECPSCGEIQARARAPEGTVYSCRKCGKPIPDPKSKAR